MAIQKIVSGQNIEQGYAVVSADKLGNYDSISTSVAPTGLGGLSDYSTLDYKVQDPEDSIKHAVIDVDTSSSGVVSAIPGQRIEVVDYAFLCDAAATVTIYSGGTAISGPMTFDANGGISHANGPVLRTNAGEALIMVASAGNVNGHISYRVS
jgi:hypothetical protein